MTFSKHKIELKNLDKFYQDYLKVIRKGDADLDHFYCTFKYQDDINIYMLSIFEFIDAYPKIEKNKIKIFYSCQVLNT